MDTKSDDNTADIFLPPDHPKRNQHHNGGYRDEQDYYDNEFGKGPGDPDFHTPPWEMDEVCDTE